MKKISNNSLGKIIQEGDKFIGEPIEKPDFLYIADKKVWGDRWQEKAKEADATYNVDSNTFEMEFEGELYGKEGKFNEIFKIYNNECRNYNEEVESERGDKDEFAESRKKFIEDCVWRPPKPSTIFNW